MFDLVVPVIHLVIDVQDRFLNDLSVRRNLYFSAYLQGQVDKLRDLGIPTLWVAYRDAFKTPADRIGKIYSVQNNGQSSDICPFDGVLKSSLGLPEIHLDDLVYVKKHNSVFADGVMDTFLNRKACRNLLVSGMNTHACVSDSIRSALMRVSDVYPLVDCLADKKLYPDEPFRGDPGWHVNTLQDYVWGRDGLPQLWQPLHSQKLIESLRLHSGDVLAALKATEIEKFAQNTNRTPSSSKLKPLLRASIDPIFW